MQVESSTPADAVAAVREDRPWRLVAPEAAWSAAVRPLLVTLDALAVGAVRIHETRTARELLVERLTVTNQPTLGSERAPLEDWIAVAVRPSPAGAAAPLVARLAPMRYQTLTLLVVGADAGVNWWAGVWTNGAWTPIHDVRLVGAGMLRLGANAPLVDVERRRWSRTLGAVGPAVFAKLHDATATLVGAGRNGSLLALQLASLGVGRLRLIDPDALALENLDAMPGLAESDVGRAKTAALADALHRLRPDLPLTIVNRPITDRQAADLLRERSDLLVTAVDHDTPRLAVAMAARQPLTVHLDVGTSVQHLPDATGAATLAGDVRLFLPGAGGCVACVGGFADPAETWYDLHAPAGSLRRQMRPAWNQQRAGSLISLNSITVGAAVQLWLDLLAGRIRTSHWLRISWNPETGVTTDAARVSGEKGCKVCGSE